MKKLTVTILLVWVVALAGCAAKTTAETTGTQYPVSNVKRKTGNPYVIKGVTYYPLDSVSSEYEEEGVASWYGQDFHGKQTANGELYDMHTMTAAHKTLPMPTYIRVTNLDTGKDVVVRVNDRGPFAKGRVLDLSYAAAKELGMVDSGVAKVKITVLSEDATHLRTNKKDVSMFAGDFIVQLASFTDKHNAERLSSRYDNSRITTIDIGGKTFYRVQLIGYTDLHTAQTAARNFSVEFPGAFVLAK